ncbi:ARL14 effector protein-like [Musca vetustissima]|uniref:ARL14 effector protein-like n=1 Tax=Musca vetustissima TaxID=27455 RepID=UPI002AB60F4F|nr:ARL14 effector protein-like [Musca vetustissima]
MSEKCEPPIGNCVAEMKMKQSDNGDERTIGSSHFRFHTMSDSTAKTKVRGRRKKMTVPNTKESDYEWSVANKKDIDPCDCLYDGCEGCWYPCDRCGSTKCSTFCRQRRREAPWEQQYIEWKRSH